MDYKEPQRLADYKVEVLPPNSNTPVLVKEKNSNIFVEPPTKSAITLSDRKSNLGGMRNTGFKQSTILNGDGYKTIDVKPGTVSSPKLTSQQRTQLNSIKNTGTSGYGTGVSLDPARQEALETLAYLTGFFLTGMWDGAFDSYMPNEKIYKTFRRDAMEEGSYNLGARAGDQLQYLWKQGTRTIEDLWRNRPDFAIPSIEIPNIDLPELPKIRFPEFPGLPDFALPELDLPKPHKEPKPFIPKPKFELDITQQISFPPKKCNNGWMFQYATNILKKGRTDRTVWSGQLVVGSVLLNYEQKVNYQLLNATTKYVGDFLFLGKYKPDFYAEFEVFYQRTEFYELYPRGVFNFYGDPPKDKIPKPDNYSEGFRFQYFVTANPLATGSKKYREEVIVTGTNPIGIRTEAASGAIAFMWHLACIADKTPYEEYIKTPRYHGCKITPVTANTSSLVYERNCNYYIIDQICGDWFPEEPPPPPEPPEEKKDCCMCEKVNYALIKSLMVQSLQEQKFIVDVPIVSCEFNDSKQEWEPKSSTVSLEFFATSQEQALQLAQMHIENARQASELCLARNNQIVEPIASVPLSWQIRNEGNRPQIVIHCGEEYREDGELKYKSAMYPITVPHWTGKATDSISLPSYIKGNWEGILTLADNSKVTINAKNKGECLKILNALKPWISKDMLKGALFKGGEINSDIKNTKVKPLYGRFFSSGQKKSKPDWRINFK